MNLIECSIKENCNIVEKRSSVSVKEYYYLRGRRRCCQIVFPVLYKYIECNQVTLTINTNLIADSNDNYQYIIFENSNISTIPLGVFAKFTNLKQLYLNASEIQTIHPGAFSFLTNLEKLYLQKNSIASISLGVFSTLKALLFLDMSHNKLDTIEENLFLGLFSLQTIKLNNNRIKSLPMTTFSVCNQLVSIDLAYNSLFNLSSNYFFNTTKLVELNLTRNNLHHFEFISMTPSIKKLYLSYNNLTLLDKSVKLMNIIELDLSYNAIINLESINSDLTFLNLTSNRITLLKDNLFQNSKALANLTFYNNSISVVNYDSFVGLINLKDLNLSKNKLKFLQIGCFRQLSSMINLNLSRNEIQKLDFGTFNGLSSLNILDISNNKLSYLLESALFPLKKLQVLKIDNNLLTSFDMYNLIQNSKRLQYISLSGNFWNCAALLKIVTTSLNFSVTVEQDSEHKSQNILGIACSNRTHETEEVAKVYTENYVTESSIELVNKIFNQNFKNSSFYTYFESLKNGSLDITDSIIKVNVISDNLNKVFKNFTHNVETLQNTFKNSIFYNFFKLSNVTNSLKQYFNDGFRSSAFYEYFTNFFNTSLIARSVNDDIQYITNNTITTLKNYFGNDFKKSDYYKMLNKENQHFSSELRQNYDFEDSLKSDNITSAIKNLNLTNKLNNILLIVIVMLLILVSFILLYFFIRVNLRCLDKTNYLRDQDKIEISILKDLE